MKTNLIIIITLQNTKGFSKDKPECILILEYLSSLSSLSLLVLFSSLFPSNVGRAQDLSSEYRLMKLILQIGCPSCHPKSKRKSALIQKPSAQITQLFNQHGIVEKKHLRINYLII